MFLRSGGNDKTGPKYRSDLRCIEKGLSWTGLSPIKLKLKLKPQITTEKCKSKKSKKKSERDNNKSTSSKMETDAKESVIGLNGKDNSGIEVTNNNDEGTKDNIQEEDHSNDCFETGTESDKTAENNLIGGNHEQTTGEKTDNEHSIQGDSVVPDVHMSTYRHTSQESSDRLSTIFSDLDVSISDRTFNNNISGLVENVSTDNIDINLLTDLREPD